MLTNKERIRAVIGNLKNQTWDVNPTYSMHKEDGEAFQDLEALKEYIAEVEDSEEWFL